MKVGDVISDFTLPDLHGNPVSIRDYRGTKVLIYMWASWWRCRDHLPVWQEVYQRYKENGFEILSVAVDVKGADAARQFAEDKPFTTVVDSGNVLAERFGFTIVPNGIYVDQDGVIRFIKQRLWAPDPEHVNAVEAFIEGKTDVLELPDTNPIPAQTDKSLQKELAETKYKLALEYVKQGRNDDALNELDDALLLDRDNFLIRKQRWYIRYPEKFIPVIDFDWQQEQLAREKEEEAAIDCGPDGCVIPTQGQPEYK